MSSLGPMAFTTDHYGVDIFTPAPPTNVVQFKRADHSLCREAVSDGLAHTAPAPFLPTYPARSWRGTNVPHTLCPIKGLKKTNIYYILPAHLQIIACCLNIRGRQMSIVSPKTVSF